MAMLGLTTPGVRCSFFLSACNCPRSLSTWGTDVTLTATNSPLGQTKFVESLWREFFLDPSQWWDHRSEKENPRHPDFKHKKTRKALWLDSKLNPPWVDSELAAIAPGTLQCNSFSWNKRLARHVKAGQYEETMKLFQRMTQEGMNPDKFTFIPVLNACANLCNLEEGRRIHAQILETACDSDVYVASSLVDMYAKCGSIGDAQLVFTKMPSRNVVSWNIMILGYVKCGQGEMALELYERMQLDGVEPDIVTFVGVLNSCARLSALEEGRHFHQQIVQRGLDTDIFLGSCLVDMYVKSGSIEDAWRVFSIMPSHSVVAWSTMIQGYAKCGQGQKAFDLCGQMRQEGIEPNSVTFVGLLNACANIMSLEEGRRIHKEINLSGLESDVFIGSSLVDMYAKCGSIEEARGVFDRMSTRNVVSWNAMIQGHVNYGQGHLALALWQQMELQGVEPDSVTYVGLLKACAGLPSLEEGRRIHEQISRRGYESDGFVGSSLVDMYAKCGCIEDAREVFNKMPLRDVVSWNAMIIGYVRCGQGFKALALHPLMQQEGVEPNPVTYVGLLNACASVAALGEGRRIHGQIIRSGCEYDVFLGNSLVDMYAKCGSIEEAHKVFKKMSTRDVTSWNALILGHVKSGQGHKALDLSREMQQDEVEKDHVTFVGLLKACASEKALGEGRNVHEEIIERGYESDVFVGSSLIDMYGKCGSVEEAWRVFNKMPVHNVVSWSAMIQAYVKCGHGWQALELSFQMHQEGVGPDPGTFVMLLNACASVGALEEGRRIHEQVIQRECEFDTFVSSSLVDMYIKCGSLDDACRVFDKMPARNVVAWNAIILGHVKCGQGKKALELGRRMQREVNPDCFSYVALLNACASIGALQEGIRFHEQIIERRFGSDMFVGNSLLNMYAKCGTIVDAERVFDNMFTHDVVSWNAMIFGYVRCGQGQKALELSHQMNKEGLEPNRATFVGLLNACASMEALDEGKCFHEEIIQRGWESDIFLGNGLIDMYAKCGSIEDALRVFNQMPTRDAVSWSCMLGGYAMHGLGKEALEHFECMRQEGSEIGRATFVTLLSACSHAGLVDEGLHYLESLRLVNNLPVTVEHYACMVDVLGRAGRLQEAEDLIGTMGFEPDASLWMTLLGSCRIHGNIEMGERIAKQILKLDPGYAPCYVLLSNIYAGGGKWDSSAEVQQFRWERS